MITLTAPFLFFSPTFPGGRGYKAMPLLMMVFPTVAKSILEALLYKEDGEIPIHMEHSNIHVHINNLPPYPDAGNFIVLLDGSGQKKPFCIVGETDFDPSTIKQLTDVSFTGPMLIQVAFAKMPQAFLTVHLIDIDDFDTVASFTWKGKVEVDNYPRLQEAMTVVIG